MKKAFLLFMIFACFFSCKKTNDNIKESELCDILKEMDERDQYHRSLMKTDSFFKIIASLRTINNITINEYAKLSRAIQKEYGNKAREIANLNPLTEDDKKKNDSLMAEQIKIDNINTELLIKIAKQRGYPNKDNCNCTVFPETVFRHSQPQYFDSIRPLITKENHEGRLNNFQYNFFIHYLNGRKKGDRKLDC